MHRSLTDNVNMVFDFVGENWRLWLKLMAYFFLPFSVILGSTFASLLVESEPTMSDAAYVLSSILFIAGCAVVTALQITLVKWYENHNCTLDGCNMAALRHIMPRTVLECLGIILLGTPVIILAFSSIIIPIVGFVIIFAVLPIFLVCPIKFLEPQNSFVGVVKQAFSIGYKKWGKLIAITLIMGLVTMLINNAITFPLGIYITLDSVLELSKSDSVIWSFIDDVFVYVICVAECFMIFVEMALFVLAMTYHYGSVATEVEDTGLESDIDNFAQLK